MSIAPSSAPPPYYPPKRSNGCLWGCLIVLLIFSLPVIVGGGYTAWFLTNGYKSNPVLRVVGELVREDGMAQQVLGHGASVTGVEGNYFSWMPGMSRNGYDVSLEGPKGEGHLAVTAHQGASGPQLDSAILTGPDGRRYDLLKHQVLPGDGGDTAGHLDMNDTAFLGHPKGLGWLAASEAWERFSYYGMQALLVLYATHYLLLPGHVEHVWGYVPFARALESVYGALTPAAMASIIFGWYAGLVYVTPLAGGLLADRLIGRTPAVVIGALTMALGHFLMAFEASFLLALLCLLLGVGCFKGNIAAQVGDLYAEGDHRRADAFQIYYIGIQIAGIFSPLVCGTLGETVGWHWGFGAAGVGMLAGLATYLIGRHTFPKERVRGGEVVRTKLTKRDKQAVALLILLVPIIALTLLGNAQMFNTYLIWAEKNLGTRFFGWNMPVTWLLSVDTVISAVLMSGIVLFWRWYARRWAEPDEIAKMAVGAVIAAGGPLLLAGAAMVVDGTGHPTSIWWAIGFHLVNDIGVSNILPVSLALYSRAAPKGLEGMMIAVSYLFFFASYMAVGWLGSLYAQMTPVAFWLLHAALVAAGGMLLFVARRFAGNILAPAY